MCWILYGVRVTVVAEHREGLRKAEEQLQSTEARNFALLSVAVCCPFLEVHLAACCPNFHCG